MWLSVSRREVHSGKSSSEASEEGEDQVIGGLIGYGVEKPISFYRSNFINQAL